MNFTIDNDYKSRDYQVYYDSVDFTYKGKEYVYERKYDQGTIEHCWMDEEHNQLLRDEPIIEDEVFQSKYNPFDSVNELQDFFKKFNDMESRF